MKLAVVNGTKEDAVDKVVADIRNLETRLWISQHMSEVGVNPEDFDVLAHKTFIDPCTDGNPHKVMKEDIIELSKKAY